MASKGLMIRMDELVEVGDNIQAAIVDNHLVIVVDLTKDVGKTASGGSTAISNSHGFKPMFDDGLRFSLWVGKKATKGE